MRKFPRTSLIIITSANFDFARKNFKYETLVGRDFLQKVVRSASSLSSKAEFLYLRSLGADPRKFEPAMALQQFPELVGDVRLPSDLWDNKVARCVTFGRFESFQPKREDLVALRCHG